MMVSLPGLAVLPFTAYAAVSVTEMGRRPAAQPLRRVLDRSNRCSAQAASGRAALLLLGFTYDSRFAVEARAKKFS